MARRKGPSLTFEAVVEAAVEVVRAEGADALGVSRVARELGIRPPSIYNHIGKGDALARAVVEQAQLQLTQALRQAVVGVSDPEDQLLVLARTTRRWALANQGLYTLMARVPPDPLQPISVPVGRDLLAQYVDPFTRLGVAPEHAVHAVRGLRAAMHGFLLLETTGQFQLDEDPEVSFDWMVRALLRGARRERP